MAFFSPKLPLRIEPVAAALVLWLLSSWLPGCSRVVTLPEVDLEDPGWKVQEGQVLWKPRTDRESIAGDLMVAQNTAGDILVSLSKSPFPIFTAQTSGILWRIDFIDRGRSYYGFGRPPRKFIWFRLPELIDGASAPKGWEVREVADGEWTISNGKTGETIRVVLDR